MNTNLREKLEYTTAGFILSGCNILLIGTRFNVFGLFFGLIAVGFFIKALTIKDSK
jgi:hypothetical protein